MNQTKPTPSSPVSSPSPAGGVRETLPERILREAVKAAKVAEVCAILATQYNEKGNTEGANWKPQVSYRVAAAYEAHLKRIADAIAALSSPATGEAVAWHVRPIGDKGWHLSHEPPRMGYEGHPLYATPPAARSEPAAEMVAPPVTDEMLQAARYTLPGGFTDICDADLEDIWEAMHHARQALRPTTSSNGGEN